MYGTRSFSRTRADSPTLTCTADGCARPLRARGLCATHYNAAHVTRSRAEVPCAACGTLTTKRTDTGRAAQFCSPACRADHQFGATRPGRRVPSTELATYVPPPRQRPTPKASIRGTGGVFVAGECAWCRSLFVALSFFDGARYCSRRCRESAAKYVRGRFIVPPPVRLAIYERDGWTCQLCLEPVDKSLPPQAKWAATLDHIVCQSWGDEPDHSPANLRLAHRMCNSIRGNRPDAGE